MGSRSIPFTLQYDPRYFYEKGRFHFIEDALNFCAHFRLPVPSRRRIFPREGDCTVEVILQCNIASIRRLEQLLHDYSDTCALFPDFKIIRIFSGHITPSPSPSEHIISTQSCDQDPSGSVASGKKRPGSLQDFGPPLKRVCSLPGSTRGLISISNPSEYQTRGILYPSGYALPAAPPARSLTDSEKRAILAKTLGRGDCTSNQVAVAQPEPPQGPCSATKSQGNENFGVIARPSRCATNPADAGNPSGNGHEPGSMNEAAHKKNAPMALNIQAPSARTSSNNTTSERISIPDGVGPPPLCTTQSSPEDLSQTTPPSSSSITPAVFPYNSGLRGVGSLSDKSSSPPDSDPSSDASPPSSVSQTQLFSNGVTGEVTLPMQPPQVRKDFALQHSEQSTRMSLATETLRLGVQPQVARIRAQALGMTSKTPLSTSPPGVPLRTDLQSIHKFSTQQPAAQPFGPPAPQVMGPRLLDSSAPYAMSQQAYPPRSPWPSNTPASEQPHPGCGSQSNVVYSTETALLHPTHQDAARSSSVPQSNVTRAQLTSLVPAHQLQPSLALDPRLKNSVCRRAVSSQSSPIDVGPEICPRGALNAEAVTLHPIRKPLQTAAIFGKFDEAMLKVPSEDTPCQPHKPRSENLHSECSSFEEAHTLPEASAPAGRAPIVEQHVVVALTKPPEKAQLPQDVRQPTPTQQDTSSSHSQSAPEASNSGVAQAVLSGASVFGSPNAQPSSNTTNSPSELTRTFIRDSLRSQGTSPTIPSFKTTPSTLLSSVENRAQAHLRMQRPATPPVSLSEGGVPGSPLFTPDPSSPLVSGVPTFHRDVVLRDRVIPTGGDARSTSTVLPSTPLPQDTATSQCSTASQQPGAPISGALDEVTFDPHHFTGSARAQESLKRPCPDDAYDVSLDSSMLRGPPKKCRTGSSDLDRQLGAAEDAPGLGVALLAVPTMPKSDQTIPVDRLCAEQRSRDMLAQSQARCYDTHKEVEREQPIALAETEQNRRIAYAVVTMRCLTHIKAAIANKEDAELTGMVEQFGNILGAMDADPDKALEAVTILQDGRVDQLKRRLRLEKERCKCFEDLSANHASQGLAMEAQLAQERTKVARLSRIAECHEEASKKWTSDVEGQRIRKSLGGNGKQRSERDRVIVKQLSAEKKALEDTLVAKRTAWETLQLRLEVRKQKAENDLSSCSSRCKSLESQLNEERAINLALRHELDTERTLRVSVEQEVKEVRMECEKAFVVPELLEIFRSLDTQAKMVVEEVSLVQADEVV